MAGRSIVSADNHVFEPPDLWTARIESEYRDRAPRIESMEDGDWWVCDGVKGQTMALGSQVGVRFESPEKLTLSDRFENVRPGGYIPEEHVKDMESDGIDRSILYPTAGQALFRTVPDGRLLSAVFSTYNEWIAEFCKPFPGRLFGIGMINLDDVHEGVRELERCADLGLVGALIPVFPPEEMPYDSEEYDPFWAAAQDLEMPLSMHIGTNRRTGKEFSQLGGLRPAVLVNVDYYVRMSLAQMIFSGVFERYPKLHVGSVEMELSWVPHFLERMDYNHTQKPIQDYSYWRRFKNDLLPSDFFHRNVFLGFQEDGLGIRLRDIIGVDQLQWGSDYPHFESTFPRSRQILEDILAGCTDEEKAKITGGNAARVYRLG